MKKSVLIILYLLFSYSVFSQFGGGTGTENDPYRLYNLTHLEEFSDNLVLNDYAGTYFVLMNNIEDTLRRPFGYNSSTHNNNNSFAGFFNGRGFYINIAIDSREFGYNGDKCLFYGITENARLDSLVVNGYIYQMIGIINNNSGIINSFINNAGNLDHGSSSSACSGICSNNSGIIENCINNSDIYGHSVCGIAHYNNGIIRSCINSGNLFLYANSIPGASAGGICYTSYVEISDCKNIGSITILGHLEVDGIAGIAVYAGFSSILNSINYTDISGKISRLGGICAYAHDGTIIENCSNYGNLSGNDEVGGIFANIYLDPNENQRVINCFNSGTINGAGYVGGIGGYFDGSGDFEYNDTIENCLNIGSTNGAALFGMNSEFFNSLNAVVRNNYYDKQMCIRSAISDGELSGIAEGLLTTEITGTETVLQSILGSEWSYDENRYPIPLGQENDTISKVKACPVYLWYNDNISNYNTVNSVTRDFHLGELNGGEWTHSGNRIEIVGFECNLISVGSESLTITSGNYSKNILINITNVPVFQQYLGSTPGNGQTNISIDTEVKASFSMPVVATGLSNVSISPDPGGTSAIVEGNNLRIPHNYFDYNETYTITIPSGTISGYNEEIRWSFTTKSDIPQLNGLMPIPEDTTVTINAEVKAVFTDRIFQANPDLSSIIISPYTGEISAAVIDNELKISHSNFDYSETYTVTIPSGTIIGIDEDIIWSFTTEKYTEVVFVTPEEDDQNVNLDAEVAVYFNININASNLNNIQIIPDPGNVTATVENNILKISHDDFEYSTVYSVTVPLGTITGFDENITWNFKTKRNLDITNHNNGKIDIYPNPTKNEIFIEGNNNINKIIIYDISGKIVLQKDNIISEKVNIEELESGIYNLKLIDKDNKSNIYKIIKE